MLFPTIEFLVFFEIVFPLTWALNRYNLAKKCLLVAASYVFYAFWDWRFVFLLFASSLGNYLFGLLIDAQKGERRRRAVVTGAVAANLLPLGFFKYYDFGSAQLEAFLSLFGFIPNFGSTGLAVPVAISFLTFHGISYVVDVYRRTSEPCRSPIDLLLYISFFPHLVAGPIVRASDFLAQLARPSRMEDIAVGKSFLLIGGGLFKKVVIASHLSTLYVDPIFTSVGSQSRLDLILGIYAYAIVIYCDFSAYTDIAIGIADLLGYKFPQNFDQPYRALSLQDFWRRWHITLSSWLRDYLYIPLGGNRRGRVRTYVNLVLTMLLGGLWHGAGLQFVLWGLLHGAGLAVERFAGEVLPRQDHGGLGRLRRWSQSRIGRAACWLAVFHFVCLTWIFFRSPDFTTAILYLKTLVGGPAVETGTTLTPFVAVMLLLGAATQILPPSALARARDVFFAIPTWSKVGLSAATVWTISVLAPGGVAPFIYFQF